MWDFVAFLGFKVLNKTCNVITLCSRILWLPFFIVFWCFTDQTINQENYWQINRSSVNHLDFWMGCCAIWYRHSWFPEDESQLLWWPTEFASDSTNNLKFPLVKQDKIPQKHMTHSYHICCGYSWHAGNESASFWSHSDLSFQWLAENSQLCPPPGTLSTFHTWYLKFSWADRHDVCREKFEFEFCL